MQKRNRIAFFNILSALLLRGISIISAPVFSRLLGTGGYGVLQSFNVWASILAIAGTMNVYTTIVNARVEYDEDAQKQYQSSIMSMSLMMFLGVSAIILAFLNPISAFLKLDKLVIVLVLVQAFGSYAVNFMNSKFTYELKAGRNMVMSVGVTLATFVLSVVFVLLLPGEINYYGRIIGNSLVYGILGVGICIYILCSGKTFFHGGYWKFCTVLAVPLAFQAISDLFLGHSDLVMLKQIAGDSVSGIYGLAYNFGSIMFAIFTSLNNTWVPFYFENMKNREADQAKEHSVYFMELYTVLSIGFVLLATEVYHIFAPQDFWGGTNLIPLFVAGNYLNFMCTFPVNFEYFYKKTHMVAAATIISSLVNIGLNYVLITHMGMYGAAIATLLSHGLQFGMHYGYTRIFLKDKEYPFGVFVFGKYAALFGGAVACMFLLSGVWFARWLLGAAIGIWELMRIYRRKVLI